MPLPTENRRDKERLPKYGNDPGELINILHGVQDTLGYLPKEVQELIALELGISAARVYGLV